MRKEKARRQQVPSPSYCGDGEGVEDAASRGVTTEARSSFVGGASIHRRIELWAVGG